MLQKLEYIQYNPVKLGYVDDPIYWRYSSARNYAGLPGLIEVFKDWTCLVLLLCRRTDRWSGQDGFPG